MSFVAQLVGPCAVSSFVEQNDHDIGIEHPQTKFELWALAVPRSVAQYSFVISVRLQLRSA